MKILVTSAVWGKAYCALFTEFSVPSLLAAENIPRLARNATFTFHIVTTRRDRRCLEDAPAITALRRYGEIEWEILENYGVARPPVGTNSKKYSFLSALQNLAIERARDHDVIIFNYSDFIWANGSLLHAIQLLDAEGRRNDAVLSFCMPVDRDAGMIALERYRVHSDPVVVEFTPRDGARIAVQHMHREARLRFWDNAPDFTSFPSYLLWPVGEDGIVIRAYHQTILALRVRNDDPQFRRGIVCGSLDANFTAQIAATASFAFATDGDRLLVFSLFHTPLDSRLPHGMTREIALRNILVRVVTPEQRHFAEHPICLKLRDGNEAAWQQVVDASWNILRPVHVATPFDRSIYDDDQRTLGVIPVLRPPTVMNHVSKILGRLDFRDHLRPSFVIHPLLRRMFNVIEQPSLLLHSSRLRSLARKYLPWSALQALRRIYYRRRNRLRVPAQGSGRNPRDALLCAGDPGAVEAAFLPTVAQSQAALNIPVPALVNARFEAALHAEGMTARIGDGIQLMNALRTAEGLLRRAIQVVPLWAELTRALGRNLWFQGRFDEAIAAFGEGEKLRDEMARTAGWPVDSSVYLPRNCAEVIGLMGHLDAFAKYKILTKDPRAYYLLAPPQAVVNQPFLNYWKSLITIIADPRTIARHAPFEPVYGVNWNWVMPRDERTVFVHEGIAAIQRAWQKEGRPPLIQLQKDHAELLAAARRKWGMAPHDKFVCLHVRSLGFYGAAHESAQRFRHIPLDSYYPAIRMLAHEGYWVIRMGDPSMPPLDLAQCGNFGRVVDYAQSEEKSAALDVALCADCTLFIGTNSGPHTVAHAFGQPACGTNHAIYTGVPWHSDDIFIIQDYFSSAKGRTLSLEEILGTDVVHCDHQFLMEREGITLLPNEADDITETVREALSPATYSVPNEAAADQVLAQFAELNRKHDRGISGRLGRYFAMKHAAKLLGSDDDERLAVLPPKKRKLDFLIAVYDRPAYLHRILQTGLALDIPGAHFVVIDDNSSLVENVPALGHATVESVCRSFRDPRVIYSRNPRNMGVAKSLIRYYEDLCNADYTSLLNPKDEFLDGAPIREALAKLDADSGLTFVVYPLRQADRVTDDTPLSFDYDRMTGKEFIARHVEDPNLQHCSGYAVVRVSAARKAGIPRDLDLRSYNLEDASGIDHDMIFSVATEGDVDFVSEAPIRRHISGGYTERFPLTFGYCQYQYARRLMRELEPRGFVSAQTRRRYLGFWHMIMARGLVVALRHVHGTELEDGTSRIKSHLTVPFLIYLPLECLRFRVLPRRETVQTYLLGCRLMISSRWKKASFFHGNSRDSRA